ncbi:Cytochrome b5 [Melipona quadrifasciata]|uniref:Cytochrome b5 n=1 Tax=Melipona quadrifasciata TaxID=166423 RepID=A0A0M9A274_9HYME|nr:Cytochrome b5 [Melipona quadrifasciata]
MSKQYTRSEVASSNSDRNRTIFIIHDKVYDVTTFLNEHPGGEEILLDHGGKDASEDFDDVGHSQDALDLMKKYLVGELIESEKTGSKPKQTWTSDYLKDKQNKDNREMSPFVWVSVLAVVMAVLNFASKKRRRLEGHEGNLVDQAQTGRTVSLPNNDPLFADFGSKKTKEAAEGVGGRASGSTRSRWRAIRWPTERMCGFPRVNRSFGAVLAANRVPSEESELLTGGQRRAGSHAHDE